MTYSLDTLSSRAQAQRNAPGGRKFSHELGLFIGAVALVYWLLALLTHTSVDPAWSTSGSGTPGVVRNWGGRLGALLGDGSFYLLGYSVWWCVLAAVVVWLIALRRWLHSGNHAQATNPHAHTFIGQHPRAMFWLGLVLLLVASCVLACRWRAGLCRRQPNGEMARLYRLRPGGYCQCHRGFCLGVQILLGTLRRWPGCLAGQPMGAPP
jgi:DNA segregation ATPase FtsK/SpoIIIE, S-DNA-T family